MEVNLYSLAITEPFNGTAASSQNRLSFVSEFQADDPPPIVITERTFTTLFFITFTSILGLLIRLGLTFTFTLPDGQHSIPLLYSQFVGCFLMGIFIESKPLLIYRHSSLYGSLASGLCGSITTFSSWNLGLFQGLSGYNSAMNEFFPTFHQSLVNGTAQILFTVGLAYSGLLFGQSVGKSLKRRFWDKNYVHASLVPEPVNFFPSPTRILVANRKDFAERVLFVFLFAGIISMIALGLIYQGNQIILSSGFAPIGAGLRYLLSRLNNRSSRFPIGTFIANVVGSGVLAIVIYFLQFNEGSRGSLTQQLLLKAIADGFCGCLSTVSTLMVELDSFQSHAPRLQYLGISIFTGQLLFLLLFWLPAILSIQK
ncbi:hypothetical protein DSO57_1007757 [Entomophthora muscae]|uniref:Uncharacterized protein n=1 Tax=Entomophthora muscae TaxID=34485 RepID=A0ACC2UGD2_9FUNG|nr:hypothetical protein DSO57_1007757 [Entomophthora muscae]